MNNNIKEPYCSFELCKLLKEKGFDISTPYIYQYNDKEGWFNIEKFPKYYSQGCSSCSIPTHALAIEWIRVNFNYFIYPTPYGENKWCSVIHDTNTHSTKTEYLFNTLQEATEAALIHTLKNLVK